MKKHFKPLQNKRDDENISSNDFVEVKSKNDSESQEILSEELIIKKSEVCMASILLFIFSFYGYLLYSRLLGGILFFLFLACFIKIFQFEKGDIHLVRYAHKICFCLVGMTLLSLLLFIIIKANVKGMTLGIVCWTIWFLSSILCGNLFCKLFFIGIGKDPDVKIRQKASREILYVFVLGLQIVLGVSFILTKSFSDENISELFFKISVILWIVSLVVAIYNKIRINGIFSDGTKHSDKWNSC